MKVEGKADRVRAEADVTPEATQRRDCSSSNVCKDVEQLTQILSQNSQICTSRKKEAGITKAHNSEQLFCPILVVLKEKKW